MLDKVRPSAPKLNPHERMLKQRGQKRKRLVQMKEQGLGKQPKPKSRD